MSAQPSSPRPRAFQNPVAFKENGRPVFRVRKNDDDPRSELLKFWYSFYADNSQPIDVRELPGYREPRYDPTGNATERSQQWVRALATEAERVIRQAIQKGCFALPPEDEPVWTCPYCQYQQASEPLPEGGEQWGRCPDCGGN